MQYEMYIDTVKENTHVTSSYNVVFKSVFSYPPTTKLEAQHTIKATNSLDAVCEAVKSVNFISRYTIKFNTIMHWCIDNGYEDITNEYLKLKLL